MPMLIIGKWVVEMRHALPNSQPRVGTQDIWIK